jgi:hypothetical protein
VTIILNYMNKATITKITAYKDNCFVARSHNKRIIYTPQEDKSIVIEFVRMLSKEEQEMFKDAQPEGNQRIVRGKVFVTSLLFTPESSENFRVFMNVVADISIQKKEHLNV